MFAVLLGVFFICHPLFGEEGKPSPYVLPGVAHGSVFVAAGLLLAEEELLELRVPPAQLLLGGHSSQGVDLAKDDLVVSKLGSQRVVGFLELVPLAFDRLQLLLQASHGLVMSSNENTEARSYRVSDVVEVGSKARQVFLLLQRLLPVLGRKVVSPDLVVHSIGKGLP